MAQAETFSCPCRRRGDKDRMASTHRDPQGGGSALSFSNLFQIVGTKPQDDKTHGSHKDRNPSELRQVGLIATSGQVTGSMPETSSSDMIVCSAGVQPYRGTNDIIMMQFERPYMVELVRALAVTPEDEVLEVGFGLGLSATAIQDAGPPKRHTIIECDADALQRCREWAQGRSSVRIVAGYWQMELPKLRETFDAVFFDDFPLPIPGEDEAAVMDGIGSRWHAILDVILSHHARVGTRITGYLAEDIDLGRPDCSFTRYPFTLVVPPECRYLLPGPQTVYVPLLVMNEACGLGRATLSGGWKEVSTDDGVCMGKRTRKERMMDAVLGGRIG